LQLRGNQKSQTFPKNVILGKVSASALALHSIGLPRAVNDSLQVRISGGRMTQGGRLLSECLAPKPLFGVIIGKSTEAQHSCACLHGGNLLDRTWR